MRYRPLGKAGMAVSTVSLRLSGERCGGDPDAWLAFIHAAFESGINAFEVMNPTAALLEGLAYAARSVERRLIFIALRLPDGRPLLVDVGSDLDISSPNVIINIDRNKAAALGVSAEQLQAALASAYGSQQISTIYTSNNQYQVILELEPRFRNDRNALDKLYVRASSGQLVPLGALATLRIGVGPLTVNHSGQLPSVTVSFNLPHDVSLGTAIARLKARTGSGGPAASRSAS